MFFPLSGSLSCSIFFRIFFFFTFLNVAIQGWILSLFIIIFTLQHSFNCVQALKMNKAEMISDGSSLSCILNQRVLHLVTSQQTLDDSFNALRSFNVLSIGARCSSKFGTTATYPQVLFKVLKLVTATDCLLFAVSQPGAHQSPTSSLLYSMGQVLLKVRQLVYCICNLCSQCQLLFNSDKVPTLNCLTGAL